MTGMTAMKKILTAALLLTLVTLAFSAPARAALPKDYKEFKARYQQEGKTPKGALKLYFEAVFCAINPATRDDGLKMLRYAMHFDRPLERSATHATFLSRLKDPRENHVFRSFAAGTSPENNYQMSPDDFNLMIGKLKEESDFTSVQLKSSGADSPRRVWVKEYDGLWYTINNAGTYSQVRPPKSVVNRKKNAHDADFDDDDDDDD